MNLKTLVFFVCLVLATNRIVCQTNKIDFGIEVGAGAAYLRGNASFNAFYKPTLGFIGGFFFQYNFKKIISIRTGISGETKGCSVKLLLTDASGRPINEIKLKTMLFYTTLPVLIRTTFGEKFKFFVNAGPYVAYLVNQPNIESLQISLSNNVPLKKIDVGLTSGLGISIPIKEKAALSLEIRHNLGLYNISSIQYVDNYSIKTTSANLLLSYTHKLGQRNKPS